jgi:hypothetical protein
MDERLPYVARLLEGEGMTEVCRGFGISRKTGYKIFNRYKEHGLQALSDRSRRPRRVRVRQWRRRAQRLRRAHEEGGLSVNGRPLVTDQPADAGGTGRVVQLPSESLAPRPATGFDRRHGDPSPSAGALYRNGHPGSKCAARISLL